MGMHCGCDLGNEATAVCSLDGRRQVQLQVSVKTESREIREIVKRHWGLAVIVEAAPRAEWFCREGEAVNKGHTVTIVCPRQAKAVLSGNAKKKTDRMWIWVFLTHIHYRASFVATTRRRLQTRSRAGGYALSANAIQALTPQSLTRLRL